MTDYAIDPQPRYMVEPWPGLLIDVRRITRVEYQESRPLECGITLTPGVWINQDLYRDKSEQQYRELRTCVFEWHEWHRRQSAEGASSARSPGAQASAGSQIAAAAPDLYAALKALLLSGVEQEDHPRYLVMQVGRGDLAQARAALAKAEGASSASDPGAEAGTGSTKGEG